jgi:ubiquitin fusion degradation protein 1
MTKGDVFQFSYNDKKFAFNVLEVRPGNSVSIVETDINVDFAPPLDYVEPDYKAMKKEQEKEPELPPDVHVVPTLQKSLSTSGGGQRLGGKKIKTDAPAPVATPTRTRLTLGTSTANVETEVVEKKEEDKKADYWASLGSGNTLKKKK